MMMALRVAIVAAIAVGLCACDAEIPTALAPSRAVTISTDVHSTCTSETRAQPIFAAGEEAPMPAQEMAASRTFAATRTGSGYEFVIATLGPGMQATLRAQVRADGSIAGAAWDSGAVLPGPFALTPDFALASARMQPERVVMGRTFRVGDEYYPQEFMADAIQQFAGGAGMPIDFTGTIHMPFQGEQNNSDGDRVLVWAGEMEMAGSGREEAADTSVAMRVNVRVVHDAETGLLRESELSGPTTISRNGVPIAQTQFSNTMRCVIVSN